MRLRRLSPLPPKFISIGSIARPEIKRFLEFLRQLRERHVFVDVEMLHQRALQLRGNKPASVSSRAATA